MPTFATLPATAGRLAAPGVATALLAAAAAFLGLAGEASRAQGGAIRLDVSMGHHTLAWQGEPGAAYTVRLSNPRAIDDRNPDGEKVFVTARADATGAVRVLLHNRGNYQTYASVEPGDRLELAAESGPALLDLVVPDVGADASDDGARVAGLAPAGATVTITLEAEGDPPPFRQAVVARDDGEFVLDLPAERQLAEGAGGKATFVDGAGHRYADVFARRRAELTMDSAYIETRASQQAPIGAERVVEVQGRRVVQAFGTHTQSPEGLGFDGRRLLTGDANLVVHAGDVVTFTQQGGPLRRNDAWVRTLPDLAIRFDGARVVGQAPSGAILSVDAGAPGEAQRWSAAATADAAGVFALDLPEGMRAEAGWWAHARLDTGDGIWLRATTVVPLIEASVGAAHVGIDMQPFQPVTLTVTSPAGEARYHRAHRASATGRLDVQLPTGLRDAASGRRTYVALRPGDRLAVALDAGDPLVFTIPSLVARTDPDSEALSGTAPPNDALRIAVVDGDATLHRTALADGDGRWRLDLAGDVDLEPDVYARVDWLERGHRFYAYTAARGMRIHLDGGLIETWPSIAYPVTVTLTTGDGRLSAIGGTPLGEVATPEIGASNYVELRDRFDHRRWIEPGDVLTAAVGADAARVVAVPLELRAHVADDIVLGRTVPGGRVSIGPSYDPQFGLPLVEVVADTSGAFRHEFAGTHDIAFNDDLVATLQLGRDQLVRALNAPGLTLDLSSAVLEGSLEPGVTVAARVGDPVAPEATGSAEADRRAAFAIALVGPDGRAPRLNAGQPIAVDAPAATLSARLDWAVPDVAFVDGRAEVVVGTAPPGSLVQAARRAGPLGLGRSGSAPSVAVQAGADGRWEASLGEAPVPGWMTTVTVELPDGHRAARRDVVPIVRAHLGTPQVCGIGMPSEAVHVEAHDDAGNLLGTASGYTDREGRFDMRLAGDDGVPSWLDTGHVLSARVGEAQMGLTIGPMGDVSTANGRASATVLPNAQVLMSAPASGCLRGRLANAIAAGLSTGSRTGEGAVLRSDDAGRVSTTLLGRDVMAYGVSIVVFTASGQSYMGTHFPAPFGTAYVDSDRVAGLAAPGSRVAVRLEDSAGAVLGRAQADAAVGDGRFVAALRADDGADVIIRPGSWVVLDSGTGTARFQVEPLAFDYNPARGLDVVGPPDRPIAIQFTIRDRVEALAERTDAEGRFAFRPDEVPPRAGWALGDLTEVEVLLMQPGDHATGYAWVAEDDGGRTVWLPWGGR